MSPDLVNTIVVVVALILAAIATLQSKTHFFIIGYFIAIAIMVMPLVY